MRPVMREVTNGHLEMLQRNPIVVIPPPMTRLLSYSEFKEELQYNIRILNHEIHRLYLLVRELRELEADQCDIVDCLEELESDLKDRARLAQVVSALPASFPSPLPCFHYDAWIAFIESATAQAAKHAATSPQDDEPRRNYSSWLKWARSKRTLVKQPAPAKSNASQKPTHNRGRHERGRNRLFSLTAVAGRFSFSTILKYQK